MRPTLRVVAWFLVLGVAACGSAEQSSWDRDIDLLVQKIETYHPRPWLRVSKQAFLERADHIKRGAAGRTDEQIAVDLMGLVSLLHDGHTRIWLNAQPRFNRWFPVRLEHFADGVFITAARADLSHCLGARVLRIEDRGVEEVYAAVGAIVSPDSHHGVARIAPNFLSNAAILRALGIVPTDERVRLDVQLSTGERRRVTIDSAEWNVTFKWAWVRNAVPTFGPTATVFDRGASPLPRHLRRWWSGMDNYWFEFSAEKRLLYVQFNDVSDSGDPPFPRFVESLFATFDSHAREIDRFVIDVRFNEGGNGNLLKPLIHEFVKRGPQLPRGRLYIITGPQTFSAATYFVGLMLKHTEAVTVGDITAGPLNWCSDVFKFTLPHSRLFVDVSTMCWQEGHATDDRGYYPPDVYVPTTAKAFFSGEDPALQAILTGRARSLKDILRADGVPAFRSEYDRRVALHGPPQNWFPYAPFDLVSFALFDLASMGRVDEAVAVSELNTRLYPNDARAWSALAMLHQARQELPEALACFEKVAGIEPHMTEVAWSLERLKALITPYPLDRGLMNSYAGRFGNRTIGVEGGGLFYQRDVGDKETLIPMSERTFVFASDENNRLEFIVEDGAVTGIRIIHYNGTSRRYAKR